MRAHGHPSACRPIYEELECHIPEGGEANAQGASWNLKVRQPAQRVVESNLHQNGGRRRHRVKFGNSPEDSKTSFFGDRIVCFRFLRVRLAYATTCFLEVRLALSEQRTEACTDSCVMHFGGGVPILVPPYRWGNKQTPKGCKRFIAFLGLRRQALVNARLVSGTLTDKAPKVRTQADEAAEGFHWRRF